MDDAKSVALLKAIFSELKHLKKVPLKVVIRAITDEEITHFDLNADKSLRDKFENAIRRVFDNLNGEPMVKSRANEAGNAIEARVKAALIETGLSVETPKSKSGKAKSAGYPDLLVIDETGRKTYLECKTFSQKSLKSTLRSFYLSPSDEFKVSDTARHFLLAFVVEEIETSSGEVGFISNSAKLFSLEDMVCDIKFEVQSNNKRMYSDSKVILDIKNNVDV